MPPPLNPSSLALRRLAWSKQGRERDIPCRHTYPPPGPIHRIFQPYKCSMFRFSLALLAHTISANFHRRVLGLWRGIPLRQSIPKVYFYENFSVGTSIKIDYAHTWLLPRLLLFDCQDMVVSISLCPTADAISYMEPNTDSLRVAFMLTNVGVWPSPEICQLGTCFLSGVTLICSQSKE